MLDIELSDHTSLPCTHTRAAKQNTRERKKPHNIQPRGGEQDGSCLREKKTQRFTEQLKQTDGNLVILWCWCPLHSRWSWWLWCTFLPLGQLFLRPRAKMERLLAFPPVSVLGTKPSLPVHFEKAAKRLLLQPLQGQGKGKKLLA